METFHINREIAHLIVLQRIELAGKFLNRLRKLFGRYIFTNFFSKYLINVNYIGRKYHELMRTEYLLLEKYLINKENFLCIGAGVGGLEVIINISNERNFTFIEKDYVSKKIKYGWDNYNKEAYNSLKYLDLFLKLNNLKKEKYRLINFDKDEFPIDKFDVVISLYSLDFHYDFEIYKNYLMQVSNKNTVIIFDTIRPSYFFKIFEKVEILKEEIKTVHKSKRIACSGFKYL